MMNQADTFYQEILQTLDKLLVNLGLLLEDYNVNYLSQADLYVEIYKVMFPVLQPSLSAAFSEDLTDGDIIQYLIDILSKEIIKMDLSHIKGEQIAEGDLKNILNFLQLLYEISKMAIVKEDDRQKRISKRKKINKPVKSSGDSIDQLSSDQSHKSSADLELEQKHFSVQGINGEFSNSSGDSDLDFQYSENNYDIETAGALFDERPSSLVEKAVYEQQKLARGLSKQKTQSVSVISEVSKSKESSEYERGAKKPSRGLDEFNNMNFHIRNPEADATKYGSCTSEDIREIRGENQGEDGRISYAQENVSEHESDQEPIDEPDYSYEHHEEVRDPRYLYGDEEIIEEEEEGSSEQRTRKITRELEGTSQTEYNVDERKGREDNLLKVHKVEGKRASRGQDQRNRNAKYKVEPRNGVAGQKVKVKGRRREVDETRGESTNAEERGSKSNTKYTASLVKVSEDTKEEVQNTKKVSNKKNPLRKILTQADSSTKGSKKSTKTTAGSFRKEKANKTTATSKIMERKAKENSLVEEKKLVHSKSDKNLPVNEPKDSAHYKPSFEEPSEERGLKPKNISKDEEMGRDYGDGEEHEGEVSRAMENQDLDGEEHSVPNGNLYKILSENIVRAKQNMRENNQIQDIPYDNEKTVMAILQQKHQYKQYLNDFIKAKEMRERNNEKVAEKSHKNLTIKLKSEMIKDENLRKEFENQQKSFYFKMRDEKVNYLRHVHKVIFSLEKKRVIEEKKEYLEQRKSRNDETQNMIDSVKNEYKNKLDILREKNITSQFESKIANDARRQFFRRLQSDIKVEQAKEAERLKDKWRVEKEKFEMMIRDEGFLEKKIMQMYKQGAF